ncbi:DUF342 domain-containing protein [Alteribacillus sp. HJP-4]|uniref:DUF342 domain-containing protein n=1 Tax=Alteribacillus sp. HJP-4 TaxID=2775394 RepID=UPI0035CD0353
MSEKIQDYFEIEITPDFQKAVLTTVASLESNTAWTREDWILFLEEYGVRFGIVEAVLEKIVPSPHETAFPIIIARGVEPIRGRDAYMRSSFSKSSNQTSEGDVDLKAVIDIPMVSQGDLAGEKVEATPGTKGKTIDGKTVDAAPGKDFSLYPGENTRVEGRKLFAVASGQISVHKRTIHVYPLYEINGDVGMKTGNITFTGNVTVKGNVLSGFSVKAEGDIRISGTVEGAFLEAGGSIHIGAGVTAQHKGSVTAGKDVVTTFINEAYVKAGGLIQVKQMIMHSYCESGDSIICNAGKGQVVGGSISAVHKIHVKEAGNIMNTPTSFYIGLSKHYLDQQKHLTNILRKANEELKKLDALVQALAKKADQKPLSSKERIMKLRARNTIEMWKKRAKEAMEEVDEWKEVSENEEKGIVWIDHTVHSNVDFHFGKYTRKLNTAYKNVSLYFENGEVALNIR